MEQDLLFWLWLANALGPGNSEAGRLLLTFDNPYTLFRAESDELERIPQIRERTVERLSDKNLQPAYEILHYCEERGIGILHYGGPGYPERLRGIADPPVVLYYRGQMPDLDQHLPIAVVGTRRMSAYGRKNAYTIAYELAYAGAVVVSGMALGIDSVAACGAIEAGGQTVAVLGCGVDVTYPSEHAKLLETITHHGAVVSEYPPGAEPAGFHFPVRNRIISGLSAGTLVVEADEKSGALITAHHALEQGRNIFSIPANLGEKNAAGTNLLLHDGAIMVLNAGDILHEYPDAKHLCVPVSAVPYSRVRSEFGEDRLLKYGVRDRVYTQGVTPGGEPAGEAPAKGIPQTEEATPTRKVEPKANDAIATPAKERKRNAPSAERTPPRAAADHSEDLVASLSPIQKEVFEALPLEGAVALDQLTKDGKSVGAVIAALTVLEIRGLIHSLPGGLYTRA